MTEFTNIRFFYFDCINGKNYIKMKPYYEFYMKNGIGNINSFFEQFDLTLATITVKGDIDLQFIDSMVNSLNASHKLPYIDVGLYEPGYITGWYGYHYEFQDGIYDSFCCKKEYPVKFRRNS